jgi:hypothetical protein
MLSVGILIIAFALWWKEEKVDLTIFKAFWLVFIGADRPLRTEIIQKVKEHKK